MGQAHLCQLIGTFLGGIHAPSCQLPWHWSSVCIQLLLGMKTVFHLGAHSQAWATQLGCETLGLAAGTWQLEVLSCPHLFSAISKHF